MRRIIESFLDAMEGLLMDFVIVFMVIASFISILIAALSALALA